MKQRPRRFDAVQRMWGEVLFLDICLEDDERGDEEIDHETQEILHHCCERSRSECWVCMFFHEELGDDNGNSWCYHHIDTHSKSYSPSYMRRAKPYPTKYSKKYSKENTEQDAESEFFFEIGQKIFFSFSEMSHVDGFCLGPYRIAHVDDNRYKKWESYIGSEYFFKMTHDNRSDDTSKEPSKEPRESIFY